MATSHQLPDWETPSSPAPAHRSSLASKFSFLTSLRPAAGPVAQKESITSSSLEESQQIARPRRRGLSDRKLPPWLAFCGTPRRLLYCSIAALLLLILILGLAIGLSKGKGYVDLIMFNWDLSRLFSSRGWWPIHVRSHWQSMAFSIALTSSFLSFLESLIQVYFFPPLFLTIYLSSPNRPIYPISIYATYKVHN